MRQKAVVRKRRSVYIVWIIPFVALAIASWMTFDYYQNKGFEIVVTFDSGEGFAVGKTPLMYKGIKIGEVSAIDIDKDLTKVDVTITVNKKATGVARKGNVFWKVEPKVSLTEVTGLSTILSGAYINLMPAKKDIKDLEMLAYQEKFTAVDHEPMDVFDPGLLVLLHAETSGIHKGAPILFRKMVVGKVTDVILADEGVDYLIHIDSAYRHLVKKTSRFWKVDGIELKASLSEIRVEMDSLASLLAGGIALDSPEESEAVTEQNSKFKLFKDHDEVYLDDETFTLRSTIGYNIDERSTKVYFKGMSAGYIAKIDYDAKTDMTTFKIRFKSAFKHLIHKGTYFWAVSPEVGLSTVEGLDAIVRGSYIAFDVLKDSDKQQKVFRLHQRPMPMQGKHFTLMSEEGYALRSGVNITYNDVVIGAVHSVALAKDRRHVAFDIVITNKYAHLVNDSSMFYLKHAIESEMSLEGMFFKVGSVEEIFNGAVVLKTQDLAAKSTIRRFALLDGRAAYERMTYFKSGGKTFTISTDTLGSLKVGAPIYFKDIKVGQVKAYRLDKKSDKVKLKVYIEPGYSDRVNASTKFYDISGVKIEASLDGVDIRTASLSSVLSGGIAFKTPLKEERVDESHTFRLYADEQEADADHVEISLMMEGGFDLKEGSRIVYRSMTVGRISSMKLEDDTVIATALVDARYRSLFTKDATLWVEQLQVGLSGVENASALLSGPYIKLMPGSTKEVSDHFFVSDTVPAPTIHKKGLRVVVKGSRLSSLEVGSPVFYRQVKIGSIEQYRLSDDATSVEMMLYIDRCHAYLVRKNSLFYNAGAFGMDVSLFGVKVTTETMKTMVQGGIALVTPDDAWGRSEEMRSFKLYDKPEASWLDWAPRLSNDEPMCE